MGWIVLGFEGTGTQWKLSEPREDLSGEKDYEVQRGVNTGSFVAQFVKLSPTKFKRYFPGPNIYGSNCDDIFRTSETWFEVVEGMPNMKICLVGYSRGAYIAMCFAKYLKHKKRKVDFMGLFDPVTRDLSMQRWGTGQIASNVNEVRIAYRSNKIGSRRTSMNHSGLSYESSYFDGVPRVDIVRQECPGSHGALGGFPNGAGTFDKPRMGQGHPKYPNRFHPDKEFTAWWLAGNFISVGAKKCGVLNRSLVPPDRSRFCLPRSEWYKHVSYNLTRPDPVHRSRL